MTNWQAEHRVTEVKTLDATGSLKKVRKLAQYNLVYCLANRSAKYSKNTLKRRYPIRDKADQKHTPLDVFEFPDKSDASCVGNLREKEQDEEVYETFAPLLHSTAIYADGDEFTKQAGSSVPSTSQEKAAGRSPNTSENDANGNEPSIKNHAKKQGEEHEPIPEESESSEQSDVTGKDRAAEKIHTEEHEPVPAPASSEPSERQVQSVAPEKVGPINVQTIVEKETQATESKQASTSMGSAGKTVTFVPVCWINCWRLTCRSSFVNCSSSCSLSCNRLVACPGEPFHSLQVNEEVKGNIGKVRGEIDIQGQQSLRLENDSDTSDSAFTWNQEKKEMSDITELDIVLSAFEKTFLKYKHKVESRICKEAVNKFCSNIKEELSQMIKDVQLLKNMKQKNTKIISGIEKKRQRLIEVQGELLRLEPQLKQLQTKYDELQERKSSLNTTACFLSNLKQLHDDYSEVREKEQEVMETYDSSSLPALLFKARGFLGAETHLQNINQQLEMLLDQE
ncbi:PREDICTED: centromere protein U [Elephantulus edwardii]|uniref:centromere protein U n=1 Tax=Elephantulus edwardii TaxID=28737 RepID=UPI0003F081CC|nr:PREDICTED: centromere protein U [Elephantulus edwardii]